MTDIAATYRRRADALRSADRPHAAERWSSPSPCDGWSARDVVAHVVDFSATVLRERAGVSDAPEFTDFDDPAEAFRRTREAVQRILDDPDTPSKLAGYLEGSLSFDLPQHGWDLAMATGQDATMDPDEVEYLWTSLTQVPKVWDWQRAHGWYGPPVSVPDDAPLQDRVLGLLGRDPGWTPPRASQLLQNEITCRPATIFSYHRYSGDVSGGPDVLGAVPRVRPPLGDLGFESPSTRSTSGRPHPGAPPRWPCGFRPPPPRRSRSEEGAATTQDRRCDE